MTEASSRLYGSGSERERGRAANETGICHRGNNTHAGAQLREKLDSGKCQFYIPRPALDLAKASCSDNGYICLCPLLMNDSAFFGSEYGKIAEEGVRGEHTLSDL